MQQKEKSLFFEQICDKLQLHSHFERMHFRDVLHRILFDFDKSEWKRGRQFPEFNPVFIAEQEEQENDKI